MKALHRLIDSRILGKKGGIWRSVNAGGNILNLLGKRGIVGLEKAYIHAYILQRETGKKTVYL